MKEEPGQARAPRTDNALTAMQAYRNWLVQTEHKASVAFDRAVMTLSGGALAISLTFINDVIVSPQPGSVILLALAWGCLALSIGFILTSMLTSQRALRKAIIQVDTNQIYKEKPGGLLARLTNWLNIAACLAFILGIALLAWFAIANMTEKDSSARFSVPSVGEESENDNR